MVAAEPPRAWTEGGKWVTATRNNDNTVAAMTAENGVVI